MMAEKPLFSIIIPTFNRPSFLREAIESVLTQTYTNFEIVVIDDHSKPSKKKELEQIERCDQRIEFIWNPKNLGVSACRNIGLNKVKGDFIIFLDDDDCLAPNLLEVAYAEFSAKKPMHVLVFSAMVHPSSNNDLFHYHGLKRTLARQSFKRSYNENSWLIILYPPQMGSMVFKKEVFNRYQFNENIDFGEDIYLWLQLINDFSFSIRVPTEKSNGALIRAHGNNHLSQAAHQEVISFLMRLKKEYAQEGPLFTSAIDVKVYMRQLLLQSYGASFKTFFHGLRKSPFIFLFMILSQFSLKSKIILSYQTRRLFTTEA